MNRLGYEPLRRDILDTKAREGEEYARRLAAETVVASQDDSIRPPKESLVDESNRGREGSLTLPFTRLGDLIANLPPEPEWLWHGYLAQGALTLLAGRPKVGKSTLVFALMSAVLRGAEFLGRPTRKARIVLLTEENPATLVEKVQSWGVGDVEVLTYQGAGGAAWPTVVEETTMHCGRIGADMLVIDTLAQWARLPGDSENDAGTALDQMRPLQHAAGTGLAILVVSHQRKSDGEYGDAIRGSNATAAAVDVIVEVERPKNLPGENVRAVKAVSRFGATPTKILMALTDGAYHSMDEAPSVKTDIAKQTLLDMLATLATLEGYGGATPEMLHEATGIPMATITRHLKTMEDEGRVRHEGKGVRNDPWRWSLIRSSTPESLVDESNPTEEPHSLTDEQIALLGTAPLSRIAREYEESR